MFIYINLETEKLLHFWARNTVELVELWIFHISDSQFYSIALNLPIFVDIW